ncbi:hypothetical protein SAMN04487996_109198 [Dyadobacter soli]|uniref:Uncharacterized protein n=1 Tax=Dyadobacter soli TaxID=659014 RepID=A0A1G7J6C0_9BACT|nr:hypothetical protein SAMN04487996_109198 [Dyadobacter soli]
MENSYKPLVISNLTLENWVMLPQNMVWRYIENNAIAPLKSYFPPNAK